jgi:hypothetical protein
VVNYFHHEPLLLLLLLLASLVLSAILTRGEGTGAFEFALIFLKYCEAWAAAIDESNTNSPIPMNFSATFRVVSELIRSRSGLEGLPPAKQDQRAIQIQEWTISCILTKAQMSA